MAWHGEYKAVMKEARMMKVWSSRADLSGEFCRLRPQRTLNMRTISSIFLVLVVASCFFLHGMRADSLDSIRIASDAKWVVHLDWEKFRGTQIGAYVEETWLPAQREHIRAGFERDFDFDFYWDGVQSVTAFGWEYDARPEKAGVLLIRASLEIQKELRQLLESKIIADFTPLKIQSLESEFEHFYSIAGELYVAVEPGGLFLLGKSRRQLEEARQSSDAGGVEASRIEAFADYPALPESVILLAAADAFAEGGRFPLQARVLQMAKGARLAVCETDEMLLVQVELKTADEQSGGQIQSVIQGILALATLGAGGEWQWLTDLAQAVQVRHEGLLVTIQVELPIEKAIGMLNQYVK